MTAVESALLALTAAAIHAEAPTDPELSASDWMDLLRLADRHKLLPLAADAAAPLPSLRAAVQDGLDWNKILSAVFTQVNSQMIQENELLNLLTDLRAEGLVPLVLKGPILRALYPRPLLRPSVDDDLFVPSDLVADYHRAFLAHGLTADRPDADLQNADERSYHRPGSPLYVELHAALFDRSSPIFAAYNDGFTAEPETPETVRIQDVDLRTLPPTDHLKFLLLHACKHFLFSGFGLRIVTDICLFARAYAERIDFPAVRDACAALRCDRVAEAIFRIGENHLGLSAPFRFAAEVDETALLRDVLSAGLHGATPDRLHSVRALQDAVVAARGEKKAGGGMRMILFPPLSRIKGDYPFLNKRPWLLPWAWTRRAARYAAGRLRGQEAAPTESLRISRERAELLRTYDLIDGRNEASS